MPWLKNERVIGISLYKKMCNAFFHILSGKFLYNFSFLLVKRKGTKSFSTIIIVHFVKNSLGFR